ncbi:MAG: ubiquinol-cytochrome c reductase cytochrome b subunit [Actinobacteria bacterium]|nr:ubiquinol-cytochrome c reductase cytochrome b subunit [Actinomycetota bacterium]
MSDTTTRHPESPVERIAAWMDDRLRLAGAATKTLRKPFPGHWSFLLGEIALFALVVLILTGIFLTLFYTPSTREVVYDGPYVPLHGAEVSAAFDSVMRLSFEVRAGLLMRQIHHHAANVFVAATVIHLLRVFFTGAFRKPRELMWVSGVVLFLLAIGAGFTGYSLPDDLLSGTGLAIAYSTLLSIPFVGPFFAFVGFGGEFPSGDLLGRLYVFHVMLIPAGLLGVVGAHLAILFRQRHTQHPDPGRTNDNVVGKPLFPTQTVISAATFAATVAVLALLGGLFEINPVWLYGPFDPSQVFAPSQPDWYVGWLEGIYRLWPSWSFEIFGIVIPQPFIPGVVAPGIIFTALFAWPWIERRFITHDDAERNLLQAARDVPERTAFGAAALAFLLVMMVAGSNDVLAARFGFALERFTWFLRISIIVLPFIVGWATLRITRRLQSDDVGVRRGASTEAGA